MKKITFITALLLSCNLFCSAQCDKNLVIESSKTEYLDADSVMQKAVVENTIIEINKPNIVIKPADKKMAGVILSDSCDWRIPFVEGRSVYNTTFKDEKGNVRDALVTVIGSGGKLTFYLSVKNEPILIRVSIGKFEEQKVAVK
ncbi:MAG: hypothetical protein ABIN94_14045 [Ferruginibacter sp.]